MFDPITVAALCFAFGAIGYTLGVVSMIINTRAKRT